MASSRSGSDSDFEFPFELDDTKPVKHRTSNPTCRSAGPDPNVDPDADIIMGGAQEGASASEHVEGASPDGNMEDIGLHRAYVSASPDGSTAKTLIYLPDMFGPDWRDHQLLADTYAKGGFHVVMPDILERDYMPKEFFDVIEPNAELRDQMTVQEKTENRRKMFNNMGRMFYRHRVYISKPRVDSFIETLRKDPEIGKVGIVGTCWGGYHAILQARPGTGISAIAALQPSFTKLQDWAAISVPTYVTFGTGDTIVPASKSVEVSLRDPEPTDGLISPDLLALSANEIAEALDKRDDVEIKVRIFENQIHGFTYRGDWSTEDESKAMDECAQDVIAWFNEHLS
ncbi:hypothetical protein TWF481_000315 [Arthrobotrys musiformis]|uniref:Dienelactone hydrolase domain-containing protein n=1 Tax=Arthrobotrys musiformis TaxID=47236 RepID=A0AAV9WN61_9PEZI